MIPPGGTIGDALAALTTPGKLAAATREAVLWVETAIQAVRQAPGGDQYPTDESVAEAILAEIEVRKAGACSATVNG